MPHEKGFQNVQTGRTHGPAQAKCTQSHLSVGTRGFVEVDVHAKSCEEAAWHPPRRSPAFRLGVVDGQKSPTMLSPQPARGTSESAEEILKKSQAFQPIVPVEGEQAPRTLSARFGAAMKEIRLRASRRSQRVCPDPSD
eukprot:TRINITY_DN12177_c0_g1_i2.p1 TRINITY_DN12177_c0_g1~~TRINITY_DN12177_c0_g1_i2.p1  ORF type:complete len:139 (+),score=7.56 TRINITY_DN12177_c0_g1_i2:186-602(+)